MQDERVGRLLRMVRIQRGWRQQDLAALVGCSQRWISEIELGRLDAVTIGMMRKVGDILEVRVAVDAWWRRGDGLRLLDEAHAGIVEHVLRHLVEAGWVVLPEWSFNHYGERGSIDIVAWHPGTRTLLLIEVKSRLDGVQELLHTFGRKVRLAPELLARERGWAAARVATMLVVSGSSAAREVVRRHATTFDAVWPERTLACRDFIGQPASGATPFRGGIWFLATGAGRGATTASQGHRVRRRPLGAPSSAPSRAAPAESAAPAAQPAAPAERATPAESAAPA